MKAIKLEIVRPVVVSSVGRAVDRGEILEASEEDAKMLVRTGKARLAASSKPQETAAVAAEDADPAAKPAPRRRGRPRKA